MTGTIDTRLAELSITLPDAPAPAANYVPFVQSGNLVFVSGQISQGPDGLIKGRLGDDMDVAAGAQAARPSRRTRFINAIIVSAVALSMYLVMMSAGLTLRGPCAE